jgi:hypothetical protein
VVGYDPFSLCVIHKEGLCPNSGDINRLMMMNNIPTARAQTIFMDTHTHTGTRLQNFKILIINVNFLEFVSLDISPVSELRWSKYIPNEEISIQESDKQH